jgi:hypothetical protein
MGYQLVNGRWVNAADDQRTPPNTMANALQAAPAANPYQRMSGTTSGLGRRQTQHCPSGYQWNALQGRCISTGTQPPVTTDQPYSTRTGELTQVKPGQSDYAKLLAQAIDLQPQWMGGDITGR